MRGFTLIELLIVMAILASVSLAVVMNAPTARPPAQEAAERFAFALTVADDAAAISGQPLRLVVADNTYFFERYGAGEWTPVPLGKLPAVTILPPGVAFTLATESPVKDNEERLLSREAEEAGRDENDERRIVMIDPAGLPATVNAVFSGPRRRWVVRRDAMGEVAIG